ncbi:MAG: hypothetical protein K2M90_03465, partial [Treponemataceae bacterium]|nr:hypothetical protein [Treponemataceae bacterium]
EVSDGASAFAVLLSVASYVSLSVAEKPSEVSDGSLSIAVSVSEASDGILSVFAGNFPPVPAARRVR